MTTTPTRYFSRLAVAGLIALLCLVSFGARVQATAPGDVYYTAHVVQKFKYGAFGGDITEWNNQTYADTSLLQTAEHDTTTLLGVVTVATSILADAGLFEADLNSEITVSAIRGIYNQTFNDLDIEVYVRGPSGTPYDITVDLSGSLHASRENGEPGSLQDVNGISSANFESSVLTVPDGGTDSLMFASSDTVSGTTTTQILVGSEVYSLAYTLVITSGASVTQAFCVLGCMTEAADFHALSSGHVAITTYLDGLPTGVPRPSHAPAPITLGASPNPLNASTVVSVQAPAGTRTTIDVFDVSGRRVATIFDAPATGDVQSFPWDASHLPSGVYFLRARGGQLSSTRKLVLLK
jgi:hypothetical protein